MTDQSDQDIAPPESYDDLRALITDRYPSLSGQLQRIARYVLENPSASALETVSKIARQVDVQPSSLVRFAKTLGFGGYSSIQQVLRSRLISETPNYRERIRNLRGEGAADGPGILDSFIDEGMASLDQLRGAVAPEDLASAATLIGKARDVYVLARGRAFPVAAYIAYALSGLEKRFQLLEGVGGLTARRAALATGEDVLIAISFRPYSEEVVEIVTNAGKSGVPLIAITDSPLSPLALNADVNLEIASDGGRAFRSLVAPMCLAQSLMLALGHRLTEINGGGGK